MATEYITAEVWILVNQDGEYVATHDADTLSEKYEESIGETVDADGLRKVKVVVKIPLPTVIEVAGKCEEVE